MKGNARLDARPALLLALGFMLSAFLTFAAAWALGRALLGSDHGSVATSLAAVALVTVLCLVDLRLFGLRTPMMRRQTPQWFMYRFSDRVYPFLWGVDTGLVFTTVRVTSLSWAALGVTFLGLVPWWSGALYAAGFVLPQLALSVLVPRAGEAGGPAREPGRLIEVLEAGLPRVRLVGLAMLMAAGVSTVVTVMAAA